MVDRRPALLHSSHDCLDNANTIEIHSIRSVLNRHTWQQCKHAGSTLRHVYNLLQMDEGVVAPQINQRGTTRGFEKCNRQLQYSPSCLIKQAGARLCFLLFSRFPHTERSPKQHKRGRWCTRCVGHKSTTLLRSISPYSIPC